MQRLISHNQHRQLIGYLGLLLTPVLVLLGLFCGCCKVMPSLSHYYFTPLSHIFTGVLFVDAVLLILYKGYDSTDNRVTWVSGLSAIGIALCPTTQPDCSIYNSVTCLPGLHYFFAAVFFQSLAWMCLFQFRKGISKTHRIVQFDTIETYIKTPTGYDFGEWPLTYTEATNKGWRNRIYLTCGLTILAGIAITPFHILPTLVTESIMLTAFPIAWLTKGGVFFKDK